MVGERRFGKEVSLSDRHIADERCSEPSRAPEPWQVAWRSAQSVDRRINGDLLSIVP